MILSVLSMADLNKCTWQARIGVAGLGWELNNRASNNSHLEEAEVFTAAAIKARNASVKVLVLRNTECVAKYWDSAAPLLHDPDYRGYWLQNASGAVVYSLWYSGVGGPGGKGPMKTWINFANASAVDWWVDTYILATLKNPLFDGIHVDDAGTKPPPGTVIPPGFAAARAAAWDRLTAAIVAQGKWWTTWRACGAAPSAKTTASQPHSTSSLPLVKMALGQHKEAQVY